MSQDERERGKQIVENMLKELCAERDIRLGAVAWNKDFDRMRYWLQVEAGGREVKWPLSYEKLEDCVEDKQARRNIEAGLRQYVLPNAAGAEDHAVNRSENNRNMSDGVSKADVFISHATEDKPYVEPLVEALKGAGIQVWYDRITLEWGDDLRSAIDRGLANCRFGIVVFSKAFLAKKRWTEYELNGLFAREKAGEKVILPIWHGVTRDDLLQYSPAFADRLAKVSSNDGYDTIVAALLGMLNRAQSSDSLPSQTSRNAAKNSTAIAHAVYDENRFLLPDHGIPGSLTDWTRLGKPTKAANLKRMNQVLGWHNGEDELQYSCGLVNAHIEKLRIVPIEVRRFLGAVAMRGFRARDTNATKLYGLGGDKVVVSDLRRALHLSEDAVFERASELETYGLGCIDEIYQNEIMLPAVRIYRLDDWSFWVDLAEFCEIAPESMDAFTDDLDFARLDG